MKGPVADYFARSLATYDNDPPTNDYQRGHCEALKVASAELATILGATVSPLVEFFRQDGYWPYGHEGDYEGWSAEETAVRFLRRLKAYEAERATGEPIAVLLFCPKCGEQHIDAPDAVNGWNNPPHRSHLCHACGCIWRPADVTTVGVEEIDTRGEHDTWLPPLTLRELHAAGVVTPFIPATATIGAASTSTTLDFGTIGSGCGAGFATSTASGLAHSAIIDTTPLASPDEEPLS